MNHLLQFSGRRSTPVVLQTEAAECGLACLAMVASYHGYRSDLATLRRQHSISLKGATLNQLIQIAGQLKLASRPLKVELEQLDKLQLPAILHWDFNHFVVLTQVKSSEMTLHDPGRGVRQLGFAEASKHFTGVALELAPTHEFTPREERQQIRLTQLVGRLNGAKRTLMQVFLLAAALEIFAIVSPFFMQLVTDHAIVSEDRDLLAVLGVGFLLLAVVHVGINAVRSWVLMVLGTTLNLQLVSNLFRHLLKLPMNYFEKRHLGDVASRFESLNVIQRTLTTGFIEAIIDGVMAIVTCLMMLIYSWKLALVVCLAATLYGVLRFTLYRPLRQAQEEQIGHAARQQSNFLETVRGIQSVKLFNRQVQRRTVYENLLVDNFNAGIRVQKLGILFHTLNGSLFGIENIAVIWLGAALVLDGGFSIGMLFAFIAYKQQFTTRVTSFIEKGIEFKMLALHTERVADIALTTPEPEALGDASPVASLTSAIEINNLSFRYSDAEPWVLHNVNLRIEAGESVAIIGPSGCGKTTLLKIVLGLLAPSEGEVLVGGKNVQRLGAQYRNLIGTVMQEDQLFAGSLADNICFFDPEPDQARIEACAQLACVHQDVVAMPMAYNSLIGDMGTTLSGGQKQRVLLARALYKQPKILALDEATSHLDVTRERQVNDAIRQLKLTRLIIAHRPETIASADRVMILGQGNSQPLQSSSTPQIPVSEPATAQASA
ncbi:MAG: peptidase domain-containing ABC transporter [Pseudomonadota bacterium]|nr:peptidase domain-containing ABC transporter [Pseudomonadota bacterium]